MSSRRTTAAAVVLLAACGGGTSEVRLDLADEDGDCASVFASVRTISIESVATNGECRLATECAFAVTLANVGDVEDALRSAGAAGDVLLELDAGEAQTIQINGRPLANWCLPKEDGTNTPVMCGAAELDDAEDGVLLVELECAGCTESPMQCP